MDRNRLARLAGQVCSAGAIVQIGYGVLAVIHPYPAIVEPRYELLWALANAGMAAGAAGWLALDLTPSRRLAATGGWMAVTGHLLRIAVSILIISGSTAALDGPIVGTIFLMFVGMAILGVTTLRGGKQRGGRLGGWQAWTPLLTVAAGIVTATFYSIDKVVHFTLLGLLWGPAWLLLGYVILKQTSKIPASALTSR